MEGLMKKGKEGNLAGLCLPRLKTGRPIDHRLSQAEYSMVIDVVRFELPDLQKCALLDYICLL
jgi:hypothetical protein